MVILPWPCYIDCFIIHCDRKQGMKEKKYAGITETSWVGPLKPPIVQIYSYVFMCVRGLHFRSNGIFETDLIFASFSKKTRPEVNQNQDKTNRSLWILKACQFLLNKRVYVVRLRKFFCYCCPTKVVFPKTCFNA